MADVLGMMIDEYEKKHSPIDAPDPIEAIKIRMEEMQLKQIDLVNEIGGKSRVSEILNQCRLVKDFLCVPWSLRVFVARENWPRRHKNTKFHKANNFEYLLSKRH